MTSNRSSKQAPLNMPDGWYFDEYEAGTWLVVIGGRIVADGIATRIEAIRIYRDYGTEDKGN